MKQRNILIALAVLILMVVVVIFFTSSLQKQYPKIVVEEAPVTVPVTVTETALEEVPVTEIALSGPVADKSAEISGLAWLGNNLLLLPQYPQVFDENGDGFLYYLPSVEITNYLDGTSQTPLEPRPIQLVASDLAGKIPNFQGFESIGSAGLSIFLTIEAGEGTDMHGYLIAGTISPDLSVLLLDTNNLTEIPTQAKSANHADESILVLQDEIITFYETNGDLIVKEPVAHKFGFDLKPLDTIPMTNLEYRLTDTTPLSLTEFWGINYFFPGDEDLAPLKDPIAEAFGKGESQANYAQVERLVKFQINNEGITVVDTAPISLALVEDARNWEGLAFLYGRGFLIATDKFPATMLGFVPFSK